MVIRIGDKRFQNASDISKIVAPDIIFMALHFQNWGFSSEILVLNKGIVAARDEVKLIGNRVFDESMGAYGTGVYEAGFSLDETRQIKGGNEEAITAKGGE